MEGFIEVNEISDFVSYIRSIEWRDPWLIALLSFHILVTIMCFSTRNYGNFQVMLFTTLCLGTILRVIGSIMSCILIIAACVTNEVFKLQILKGISPSILTTVTLVVALLTILVKTLIRVQTILLVYFSESINEVAARNWALFSRQQYFDSKGLFISVVFSIPILLNCMIMVGSWLYQSTQIMTNIKKAQLRQRFKELNINREQQRHIKSE